MILFNRQITIREVADNVAYRSANIVTKFVNFEQK